MLTLWSSYIKYKIFLVWLCEVVLLSPEWEKVIVKTEYIFMKYMAS